MQQFESAFELYRQMAANVPDCSIYIFDHDFDYLLAEGEEITKLGVGNENLIGCNFFEVWPQEVTMTLSPYYLDTLKGKRQKLEQQTDNGYFIQHFIPIYDSNKEVVAGMVVSQNITLLNTVKQELSARDEELKDKQRLFEAIINTAGEGIMATDIKGRVVLSNPAADELLGMKGKGKSMADIREKLLIRDPHNAGELKDYELPVGMALKGAKVDAYNLQLEDKKTKTSVFAECSARPLVDANDQTNGAVLVMRDVSPRKELEKLLEENLSALKQKNARLEHFMTKLSYNLLGPTANLNILYSLLEKSENNEERESYITKIGEVAGILQQSVANISGAMMNYTASNEEWGANSFAEAVTHFTEQQTDIIEAKSISLKCDFAKAEELVYPHKHFHEVINGLLDNILQFCPPNGEVVLRSFKTGKSVVLDLNFSAGDDSIHLDGENDAFNGVANIINSFGGVVRLASDQIHVVF